MSQNDPKEINEGSKKPNVVYVVDAHGEGWYCTEEGETEEDLSGECVHEEEVTYDRGFGG